MAADFTPALKARSGKRSLFPFEERKNMKRQNRCVTGARRAWPASRALLTKAKSIFPPPSTVPDRNGPAGRWKKSTSIVHRLTIALVRSRDSFRERPRKRVFTVNGLCMTVNKVAEGSKTVMLFSTARISGSVKHQWSNHPREDGSFNTYSSLH